MFICCNMLDFVFGGYDFITSYVHKKMTNTLLVIIKLLVVICHRQFLLLQYDRHGIIQNLIYLTK